MKHMNPKSECVSITHIVNPHQFYYKYTNHIDNGTFTNFDFEIQLYGNELFARNMHKNGYVPVENELVIFFNLIFNKWIRGQVISIGDEITFWCIDNGVWEKLTAPHILPLAEQFHKNMNLVHLGGLSLLPTEKKWIGQTEGVENQLTKEWDEKAINVFKGVIGTSKSFMFTEEFEVGNHTFGLLAIKSKTTNWKEINQILLDMNSAAHSREYADEDLWSHVHDARLKIQLCKSILGGGWSLRIANLNNNVVPETASNRSFLKYGSEMSSAENRTRSDYSDDSASRQSSEISPILKSEAIPQGSGRRPAADCGEDLKPTISQSRSAKSKGADYNDLRRDPESSSTSEQRNPNSSKLVSSEEFHLRTCKRDEMANVRQPLRSTMDWIKSMNESKSTDTARKSDESCASSTDTLTENRSTNQRSPASSTTSRRNILAALAKKEPTVNANVHNSANVADPRFGIPAGYAKNCLSTFGGMNRR